MRITGGHGKGRLLAPLRGLRIRPSSDKVRETIFNLLGQDMNGLKVLDLFAGTGSFGIEALSRGASWAVFIDKATKAADLIEKNLKLSGYETSGFVVRRDIVKHMPWGHPRLKSRVDVVFIDPPYEKGFIPPLLRNLSEHDILTSTSIVITESSKNEDLPAQCEKLRNVDTRRYGDTKIDFYYYEDDQCVKK